MRAPYIAQLVSLCGNYELDEGEECDGGRLTVNGDDPCCNESCSLRSEAKCR